MSGHHILRACLLLPACTTRTTNHTLIYSSWDPWLSPVILKGCITRTYSYILGRHGLLKNVVASTHNMIEEDHLWMLSFRLVLLVHLSVRLNWSKVDLSIGRASRYHVTTRRCDRASRIIMNHTLSAGVGHTKLRWDVFLEFYTVLIEAFLRGPCPCTLSRPVTIFVVLFSTTFGIFTRGSSVAAPLVKYESCFY